MAGQGAWKELFTSPQYRRRTWVLIVCWLAGYAGLIYGVGAFLAVYMVDHGATAHEVFLTIAAAYAVLFVAFQVNAQLGERVERRDVIAVMARAVRGVLDRGVGGAHSCRHRGLLHHQPGRHRTVPVQPVQLHGGGLSDADPRGRVCLDRWPRASRRMGRRDAARTALRARAEPSGMDPVDRHPGALLPAVLIRGYGIKQSRAVLEQVST